jgi:hypothetical protein
MMYLEAVVVYFKVLSPNLLERLMKTSESVDKNRRRSTLLVLLVCSYFCVYRPCALHVVSTVAVNVTICMRKREESVAVCVERVIDTKPTGIWKSQSFFKALAYFRKQIVSSIIPVLLSSVLSPFVCLLAWNQAAPAIRIFMKLFYRGFTYVYLENSTALIFAYYIQTYYKDKPILVLAYFKPRGFQEIEALRFQDNRPMKMLQLSALRTGLSYTPGNISGAYLC